MDVDEVSNETIRQVLKRAKRKLQPWKKECWVIPPEENAEFVAAIERVLEVYKCPYNQRYPVICMDESSKQRIEEVITPIPASPSHLKKQNYEYKRNGVCNIFIEKIRLVMDNYATHTTGALYEVFEPAKASQWH